MRIAILHPSNEGSTTPFASLDPESDPSRYAPEHTWAHVHLRKMTAVSDVLRTARAEFDIFFNLCDGAWDEDRAGIEVVQALERLGVAFTGAGSRFYDPSRTGMKMAAHSIGIHVPAFAIVRHAADVARVATRLRFPMIVKHPNSYSSVGLTPASRVTDSDGLARECVRIVEAYGSALVEEFIEGREFTVLVTEPRANETEPWVLPPVEFLFPQGETFKHFDLKWRDYASMQTARVGDPRLDRRLREAAGLVFEAMGASGYGRCDFRLDPSGDLYFLEINPNCGIFYPEGQFGSADFIIAADPGGHPAFVRHLLDCALRRQARSRRAWELDFCRDRGFEMVAARDLAAGEIAVRYEERPQRIVSRSHVEKTWRGRKRDWFDRYAWPLSEHVFAMWSDDPEDWYPINHSCDPNAWLSGLDLIARRAVPKGEPLTIDYATFCGPNMVPFECRCGSPECRRVVRGNDYLRPELRAQFADHLSDFVRAAGGSWTRPLELVSNPLGVGLITRQAWPAGSEVSPLFWGNPRESPSRWTLQRGAGDHAEPLPFELRYINHGCDPNVAFDVDSGSLRALRAILPDEELTAFYPATEWSMEEAFSCRCGSRSCQGTIAGAEKLSAEALERYACSAFVREQVATRARDHVHAHDPK